MISLHWTNMLYTIYLWSRNNRHNGHTKCIRFKPTHKAKNNKSSAYIIKKKKYHNSSNYQMYYLLVTEKTFNIHDLISRLGIMFCCSNAKTSDNIPDQKQNGSQFAVWTHFPRSFKDRYTSLSIKKNRIEIILSRTSAYATRLLVTNWPGQYGFIRLPPKNATHKQFFIIYLQNILVDQLILCNNFAQVQE